MELKHFQFKPKSRITDWHGRFYDDYRLFQIGKWLILLRFQNRQLDLQFRYNTDVKVLIPSEEHYEINELGVYRVKSSKKSVFDRVSVVEYEDKQSNNITVVGIGDHSIIINEKDITIENRPFSRLLKKAKRQDSGIVPTRIYLPDDSATALCLAINDFYLDYDTEYAFASSYDAKYWCNLSNMRRDIKSGNVEKIVEFLDDLYAETEADDSVDEREALAGLLERLRQFKQD